MRSFYYEKRNCSIKDEDVWPIHFIFYILYLYIFIFYKYIYFWCYDYQYDHKIIIATIHTIKCICTEWIYLTLLWIAYKFGNSNEFFKLDSEKQCVS